ncbi:hypothetical protein SAMN04515692_104107 [Leifsonia sp. CL147]|nr:hypothetical protein SAMN04515694_104108 [Leifsonia sp. CL154]SFL42007.1 hypothetical protein SAMN04515692_104107 [Leifsonia sp. CL147]
MRNMIIEPNSLEHLVLYIADDDWLPIGDASSHAGDFELDIPTRKTRLLAVVRALAAEGYIHIGDLQYRDPEAKTGLHWAEWPGTLDEQMEHLDEVYTPEVEDDRYWYYVCWLNLTGSGRRVVEALPTPDDRFFEEFL